MKTCPKCNANYPDDAEFCAICKSPLAPVPETVAETSPAPQAAPIVTKKSMNRTIANIIIFILHVIAAAVIFYLFFDAANSIKSGGVLIGQIQSVGGKTLEEAYYQNLSYIYEGYYTFTLAFGAFCSAVITSLGIKRLIK